MLFLPRLFCAFRAIFPHFAAAFLGLRSGFLRLQGDLSAPCGNFPWGARLLGEPLPQTIAEKKALLLRHGLATLRKMGLRLTSEAAYPSKDLFF